MGLRRWRAQIHSVHLMNCLYFFICGCVSSVPASGTHNGSLVVPLSVDCCSTPCWIEGSFLISRVGSLFKYPTKVLGHSVTGTFSIVQLYYCCAFLWYMLMRNCYTCIDCHVTPHESYKRHDLSYAQNIRHKGCNESVHLDIHFFRPRVIVQLCYLHVQRMH